MSGLNNNTSMLFIEQLQLNEHMLHTASNIKITHAAVVNELNKTNERLTELVSEEYHLRNIVQFNDNIASTLIEQKSYLKNLIDPHGFESGTWHMEGFVSYPISPLASFPDDNNDLYANELHSNPNDLYANELHSNPNERSPTRMFNTDTNMTMNSLSKRQKP